LAFGESASFAELSCHTETAKPLGRKLLVNFLKWRVKQKELDSVQHIVLTTGTVRPPGKEIFLVGPLRFGHQRGNRTAHPCAVLPSVQHEGLYELKAAG